jgi:hypothetical protein
MKGIFTRMLTPNYPKSRRGSDQLGLAICGAILVGGALGKPPSVGPYTFLECAKARETLTYHTLRVVFNTGHVFVRGLRGDC